MEEKFSIKPLTLSNGERYHLLLSQQGKPHWHATTQIRNASKAPNTIVAVLSAIRVIYGQQNIVPLWTAQKIKNTIPNANMLILKECGHFPYIEKPNQLFTRINHF